MAADVITLGTQLVGTAGAEITRLARELPGVRSVQPGADGLRVYLDDGERTLAQLIDLTRANGASISTISLDRASLDDVFLAKTGRSLRDATERGAPDRTRRRDAQAHRPVPRLRTAALGRQSGMATVRLLQPILYLLFFSRWWPGRFLGRAGPRPCRSSPRA